MQGKVEKNINPMVSKKVTSMTSNVEYKNFIICCYSLPGPGVN